jgi:anti-anti-sigma factor
MSAAEVELRLTTHGEAAAPHVLTASGEVDSTNAGDFARSVRSLAGDGEAVLDLTELEYLDSAGFAVLDDLVASRRVRIVLGAQSTIRRAATLMSLPYSDSIDEALDRSGRSRS